MHSMDRVRFFRFGVWIVAGIAALGYVVMSLWNWLLPEVFYGVHTIGYVQALGLLVLCRILVGGLRGHGHGRWHTHRWDNLTPEERASFQAGRHGCCTRQTPPPPTDGARDGAVT